MGLGCSPRWRRLNHTRTLTGAQNTRMEPEIPRTNVDKSTYRRKTAVHETNTHETGMSFLFWVEIPRTNVDKSTYRRKTAVHVTNTHETGMLFLFWVGLKVSWEAGRRALSCHFENKDFLRARLVQQLSPRRSTLFPSILQGLSSRTVR